MERAATKTRIFLVGRNAPARGFTDSLSVTALAQLAAGNKPSVTYACMHAHGGLARSPIENTQAALLSWSPYPRKAASALALAANIAQGATVAQGLCTTQRRSLGIHGSSVII